jgi:hypothetical protein
VNSLRARTPSCRREHNQVAEVAEDAERLEGHAAPDQIPFRQIKMAGRIIVSFQRRACNAYLDRAGHSRVRSRGEIGTGPV